MEKKVAKYLFFLPAFLVLLGMPASGQAAQTDNKGENPILLIDSQPVYWPEFHFWLNYIGSYYKSVHGYQQIPDWNVQQNGKSLRDFFLSSSVHYVCKDRAIEALAKENGVDLSKEDQEQIEEERRKNIRIYGSEQEYLYTVQSTYGSESVYRYLTRIDMLGNALFASQYGAVGEKCSDVCVADYVAKKGLMAAKYIFLSASGPDGKALSETEIAKNRELLNQLAGRLAHSSEPLKLFDSLMEKYSDDKSFSDYPDGVLFTAGSKGAEFESAWQGLKEHEISGIVQAGDGLYLVLRMPIFAEMKVDSAGNTLRYWTAYRGLFGQRIEERCAQMQIDYKDGYKGIDVEKALR
jgi:hypothetical protein